MVRQRSFAAWSAGKDWDVVRDQGPSCGESVGCAVELPEELPCPPGWALGLLRLLRLSVFHANHGPHHPHQNVPVPGAPPGSPSEGGRMKEDAFAQVMTPFRPAPYTYVRSISADVFGGVRPPKDEVSRGDSGDRDGSTTAAA